MTAITYSLRSDFGVVVRRGVQFAVEDHLRHPSAVAQVDENDISEVAPPVYPTHEHSFFSGVGGAQRSAHVRAS